MCGLVGRGQAFEPRLRSSKPGDSASIPVNANEAKKSIIGKRTKKRCMIAHLKVLIVPRTIATFSILRDLVNEDNRFCRFPVNGSTANNNC